MAEDRKIIHEITPLMGKDVLYIADRHKKEFTYPIHNHSVYELNFVENAAGVKRIVGDSQEIIGDFDLCLITSKLSGLFLMISSTCSRLPLASFTATTLGKSRAMRQVVSGFMFTPVLPGTL